MFNFRPHLLTFLLPLFLIFLSSILAGCSGFYFQNTPQPVALGTDHATLLPAGNYHLLTLRASPTDNAKPSILCTEPSPDYATALGNAVGLSANGGVAGGPSAGLSANESSTEAITALLGRTAGVVALRDGLYSACQAYANGIIGRDAYGLIISQYGYLLTQLAVGDAAAPTANKPAAVTPAAAAPASVSVQVAGAAAAPASAGSSAGTQNPGSVGSQSTYNAQVAIMQQEALQAMLVSCITDQDTSVGTQDTSGNTPSHIGDESDIVPLASGRNPLLEDYCKPFMANLVKEEPYLLAPQVLSSSGAGKTPVKTAAAANPPVPIQPNAVSALQEILAQDGDYDAPPSGTYDSVTQAAVSQYISKHRLH